MVFSVFRRCLHLFALLGLFFPVPAVLADSFSGPRNGPQVAALDGDDGSAQSPDVPWSHVVRDIQRELRDLGLYNGPVDGLYSAEVREAISRFERLHGRIGEGTPLTDALRSIVSVRDGLKLRRSLDEVRARQTGEALQALQANPETRDLVAGTVPSKNAPYAECEETSSVDCLLAAARRDANDVGEANFHDWAMREIILTEIRIGKSSEAVRVRLRQLSDPRLVLVAMREVAEALAQDGRIDEGRRLAETIPDDENRIRAIAAVAINASKQGRSASALALTRIVIGDLRAKGDMNARVAIATALAAGLAQGGDSDIAADVVRAARDFASPSTVRLIRRAEIALLAGAQEGGAEVPETADTLSAFADSSAASISRSGDAEGVRYRVTTLSNLAVVQARAGKTSAANETIKQAGVAASRVRGGYPRDYARLSVALAQAQIGNYGKIVRILDGIRNDQLRAEGYWRVAEIAGQRQRIDLAQQFERTAIAVVGRLESGFDRSMMFSNIASAAVRAGRVDAARHVFDIALEAGRGLDAGWWRARAYARLAAVLHEVSVAEERH